MVEAACGLEADARTPGAERHIGGVVILERLLKFEAGARILARTERSVEGVADGWGAYRLDGDIFDAMAFAVNVKTDDVADADVLGAADLDVGVTFLRIHRQICLGARLAHLSNGHDLILFGRVGNGRIGGAISQSHLLALHEAVCGGHRDVVRTGRNGDDRSFRQRLPECGRSAGNLPVP